jgi:hypothetical protein
MEEGREGRREGVVEKGPDRQSARARQRACWQTWQCVCVMQVSRQQSVCVCVMEVWSVCVMEVSRQQACWPTCPSPVSSLSLLLALSLSIARSLSRSRPRARSLPLSLSRSLSPVESEADVLTELVKIKG